jgi:hypothetical protein
MGFNRDGNVSLIDVRKGNIVKIRPFRFKVIEVQPTGERAAATPCLAIFSIPEDYVSSTHAQESEQSPAFA